VYHVILHYVKENSSQWEFYSGIQGVWRCSLLILFTSYIYIVSRHMTCSSVWYYYNEIEDKNLHYRCLFNLMINHTSNWQIKGYQNPETKTTFQLQMKLHSRHWPWSVKILRIMATTNSKKDVHTKRFTNQFKKNIYMTIRICTEITIQQSLAG
jgi:hypothetical protein